MMLIIQGCCFIQSLHFSFELQEDSVQNSKQLVQFPCIRPNDMIFHPNAQLSKHHPSGRRELSVRTFLCDEKLRIVQSCIRPNVSATCLDAVQCSTSYEISFQNTDMVR
jgi:hypothetical protein